MKRKSRRNPNTLAPEIGDTVAQFRAQGRDDAWIAEQVGLSLAEVRDVDKGEPEFSKAQDARILSLRNEKGRLWMRIAEDLGGGVTGDQVKRRYDRLMRHSLRGQRAARAAKIACLGPCGTTFQSRDVVHNRLCESCGRLAASAMGIGLNACALSASGGTQVTRGAVPRRKSWERE